MLATIFNKTKPINYLLIAFALVIVFVSYYNFNFSAPLSAYAVFQISIIFILLLISFFWLNFISQKNELSKSNNYPLLVLLLLVALNPQVFNNINLVISNFFILLAFRRIVSLRTFKSNKQKIFDASLLIFIASLFHIYALVFIVVIFVAILIYSFAEAKNLLIPFIALVSVATIYVTIDSLQGFKLLTALLHDVYLPYQSLTFPSVYAHISFSLYIAFSILVLIYGIIQLPKKQQNIKGTYTITFFMYLAGLFVYILESNKDNSVLLFSMVPTALLAANFIEEIPKNKFKDAVLYTIASVSLILFFFQLNG